MVLPPVVAALLPEAACDAFPVGLPAAVAVVLPVPEAVAAVLPAPAVVLFPAAVDAPPVCAPVLLGADAGAAPLSDAPHMKHLPSASLTFVLHFGHMTMLIYMIPP